MRYFITGGVKSGKSRHALELGLAWPETRYFLATALASDAEMSEKIARHKAERKDRFVTFEEQINIHTMLKEKMILDCIPLWLNNMYLENREADAEAIIDQLIATMPKDFVIVSNEVGMGFVPTNDLARRYGNVLGAINARLASACDSVHLMIAGQVVKVK